MGLNKVLAIVSGPIEPVRPSNVSSDKGILTINFSNSPFSGTEYKRRRFNDKRSLEFESIIRKTFESKS